MILGLALTLITFALAVKLAKIKYFKKLPPIIVAGIVIMAILRTCHISYDDYNQSASFLTFLLGPGTIALAYPLITNKEILTQNKRAIWFGLLFATLTAMISTYLIGKIFHVNFNIIMSLIPKSVTTPIAVEISKHIGGIPELTACVVVITGIVGALFGHRVLKFAKIKHDIAIGLSMGASSHVMGTAKCIEKKQTKQAAISSLALIMVGIFTTVISYIFAYFHFGR